MDDDRMKLTLELMSEIAAERVASGMLDTEMKRHTDNADLFEAIIREAYVGVTMVAAGHHIMFMRDGYPLPAEIPSADALIFDHAIAQTIWGNAYQTVLSALALTPAPERDTLLRQFYQGKRR